MAMKVPESVFFPGAHCFILPVMCSPGRPKLCMVFVDVSLLVEFQRLRDKSARKQRES